MKQKSIFFMIVIAIMAMFLISGCAPQTQPVKPMPQQEVPTEQVPEELPAETELSGCDAFPEKLDACEAFSCEFEHPFTGDKLKKEILGLVDDKCKYTEQMPNSGKLDCQYSESLRKAVAQYTRDVTAAEDVGTSVRGDERTYTIDGKQVENQLEEAMSSGACVVSGY